MYTLLSRKQSILEKKRFRQKLWGSRWSIQWSNQSDIGWRHENQSDVTL